MKYLIILICLFAVPAFADDYDKNFPPLTAEIVYVVDISPIKARPKFVHKASTNIKPVKVLDFMFDVAVGVLCPHPCPFD